MRRLWGKNLIFLGVMATAVIVAFQNCSKGFEVLPDNAALNLSSLSSSNSQEKVKRLSNSEINNSLNYILGDTTAPATKSLPANAMAPFDNDVLSQQVSTPLIEGIEQLAIDVSKRLLADTTRRNQVLGCVGASVNDRICMTSIVNKFSLLFFRRQQPATDLAAWIDLGLSQAAANQNFYDGVDTVLRLFIMHPRFTYRIESDSDINLSYARAERLAFLIWGSTPDSALLSLAAQDLLKTAEQVKAKASDMLKKSNALQRVQQFHAEWLSYERLGHATNVAASLKSEADAMVEKVLFTDQRPWTDIFSMNQTYIDNTVAEIYGLPSLRAPTWTGFPSSRRGILSTGAFLSAGAKFGDTSPTQRGKFIRERLLCQRIPPPPPSVDADVPPPPSTEMSGPDCKKKRYLSHSVQGSSCIGCHAQMDPIGFGLEQYDVVGRFRSFEKLSDGSDNTSCPIDGAGSLLEVGAFNGPADLTTRLISSGTLHSCMMKQYFHFVFGRTVSVADDGLISSTANQLQTGARFSDVILSIVGSQQFLNP
ncbi:MAG: DUF1588 domain-containing protein [Bdellovibrionota bacterium]